VLPHLGQAALGRRQGVLEDDREDVGARPVGAGLRRAASELLLEQPHHLVGDGLQHRAVGIGGTLGVVGQDRLLEVAGGFEGPGDPDEPPADLSG
jgi:hypothetical protein